MQLASSLQSSLPLEVTSVSSGTLYAMSGQVQLSFMEYRYPLLQPLVSSDEFGCHLAALDDIACMKLSAVAQRGVYHCKIQLGYNLIYIYIMCIIIVMRVSIGRAAKELGVSKETLRRWEATGKIEVERTPGGHRRYDLAKLRGITPRKAPSDRVTLAYGRVASHDQKDDLVTQVAFLESFCAANGWSYEVLQDLGSGLNYNKRGLRQLIKRICAGDIERLVLTHKDRLLRFGSEIIFALCEQFNVEVTIINQSEKPIRFEEELVQDVLEIITVFSARLYGSRSHKNRKLMETLQEAAEDL